jgi:hypothetical protein
LPAPHRDREQQRRSDGDSGEHQDWHRHAADRDLDQQIGHPQITLIAANKTHPRRLN